MFPIRSGYSAEEEDKQDVDLSFLFTDSLGLLFAGTSYYLLPTGDHLLKFDFFFFLSVNFLKVS